MIRSNRRLDAGTQLLLSAALDRAPFDTRRLRSDLDAMRVTETDILDHLVPEAARSLGEDWLSDTLTFAKVSTASARLFGLCKEVGMEWRMLRDDPASRSILLCTFGREDHVVGPAVLTERLRRAGHSVFTLLNSDARSAVTTLREERHDALMISVGSFRVLDLTVKAIRSVRYAGVDLPIIVGGAVLEADTTITQLASVDLVTNDIEKALASLAKLGARPQVIG